MVCVCRRAALLGPGLSMSFNWPNDASYALSRITVNTDKAMDNKRRRGFITLPSHILHKEVKGPCIGFTGEV